jgi:hypothetical protein
MPDFRDCSTEPAELLDRADAADYAFARRPAWRYYLKYFALARYAKLIVSMPRARALFIGDRYLDPFGTTPQWSLAPGGLNYGSLSVDRACEQALVGLAADLQQRGIRALLVFAPVHPDYRRLFPEVASDGRALADRLAAAVAPLGGVVIDLQEDPGFAAGDFTDAFHLQWPAVRRLSRRLAEVAGPAPSVAQLPQAGAGD